MPQLFSRIDDLNWLTPSIADILDQGAPPPGGDGTIREQMLTLQRELSEGGTPARIVNARPTPSYTLFTLQPEHVGRLVNRRAISVNELRKSVGQIAERHKEWRIGFMPNIEGDEDVSGILLRTEEHRPLSLRRLLVQTAFRSAASNLTIPLGMTLEQQLIVRGIEQIENLLAIGEGNARIHLLSSIMLTLVLFNTPAELRIAIAGENAADYGILTSTPHALGKHIKEPEHVRKLLEGLAREAQRRLNVFYEENVNQLETFNALQREHGKLPLPRIVVALDSLSELQGIYESIIPHVRDLLVNGAQAGIHLLYTVVQPDHLPAELAGLANTEVILRTAAPDFAEKLKNFHPSLLRFIDAFIVEKPEGSIIPVELCAVAVHEVKRTVEYWLAAAEQRHREEPSAATSGTTGVTGFLNRDAASTSVLGPVPTPPTTPTIGSVRPATGLLKPVENVNLVQQQATALAAYLGWVSVNALRDILLLSEAEAHELIQVLQMSGIIETTEGAIFRFVRLAEPPSRL